MSYTVFARTYRPQTFTDLVGQEHVAKTLKNAIAADRVAHAFLFTGVRGVGKTTTARLLAKALNCAEGPTATPCNACDQCKEITNGLDLDVLEMDGASNNSVDDVRRLQESIPYRPSRDRYKVVIVDEVHMLSTGAFNAFLKTLEEPPPHVKFIFATTESHKVPITIRSRCQRYDFRLIPRAVIAERVRDILRREGIEFDEEAIATIAGEAAGSMRDALTLLDQLVAFGGKALAGHQIAEALGIAGRGAVHDICGALLAGDPKSILSHIHEFGQRGIDMLHLAKQLLHYVRELVVLSVAGDDAQAVISLVVEEQTRANELIGDVETLELERAFSALSLLVEEVARSSTPKLVLEMGLVRLATRPALRPLSELLARLEALEKRVGGGGGSSGQSPRGQGSFPSRPPSASSRTQAQASPAVPQTPAKESPRETPRQATAQPAGTSNPQEPQTREPRPMPTAGTGPSQPAVSSVAVGDDASEAPAARPAHTGDLSADDWERFLRSLGEARPALSAVLEHGVPVRLSAGEWVIGFEPGSFFGKQAMAKENLSAMGEIAGQVFGTTPKIEITFEANLPTFSKSVAVREEERKEQVVESRRTEALKHPTVQAAREVFPVQDSKVQVHVDRD